MSAGRRIERGGRALLHALLSLPYGLVCLAGALLLVLAAVIGALGAGAGPLRLAARGTRSLARNDRRLANRLLDAHVPPVPSQLLATAGDALPPTTFLADARPWRLVALLAARPLAIAAAVGPAVAGVTVVTVLSVLAVEGITGAGGADVAGPLTLGPLTGVLLLVLALPCAVLAIAALDLAWRGQRAYARALMAPTTTSDAPVREVLAESLGDRSLSIAYWLEDRRTFVDELGVPVTLPDPRSGRAWTAVERDGRRVAAIVHDASLDATPELVQAAGAAAVLALDNERLKADLRARLEELRVSRMRLVETADDARRRLERDLHDGAQQQLVALALDLRLVRARLGKDHEVGPDLDAISERLQAALAELRELARGIHPAILTQQGLRPAIDSLAGRVPVVVEADVLEERLPSAIEAAAYFVVAEGMTNVVKYSGAEVVEVTIRREDDVLVVCVADDGAGGADPGAGTGLRGLKDRVSAFDGTLHVDSPPGGGTRVTARIPVGVAA